MVNSSSGVLIVIYKQSFNCLNNNVSARFTFPGTFTMSQVSGSDLHNTKNGYKSESVTKKV